jgi:hypothetical protein
MRKSTRRAGRALIGTAVATVPLLVIAPSASAEEAGANTDPGFLQVYDANVENLPVSSGEVCKGDWHDLMYYMRTQPLKPDLYLVQQLSNKSQLNTLLTRMEEHFGESFSGVLAENNPEPLDPDDGECRTDKYLQTNAVIWRDARLSLKLSASPDNRWQAQREDPNTGKCVNNNQSRTKGVKALLRDKVSGKDVTAASFHWRTYTWGHKCTESNAGELSNELKADGYGGADLFVAGGDTNNASNSTHGSADWTPWYRKINGDLGGTYGFRDAAFAGCSGSPACLKPKWTLDKDPSDSESQPRRIDFLLARKAGGAKPVISNTVVPTFNEGDAADLALTGSDYQNLDYSDHRSVGARVHY